MKSRLPGADDVIPSRAMRGLIRALLLFALLGAVVSSSGCLFSDLRRQQKALDAIESAAFIGGVVSTDDGEMGPIVVVLIRHEEGGEPEIVDHFMRSKPGRFGFKVVPGSYSVVAFVDENQNLHYDPDEPATRADTAPTHALVMNDILADLELVIPRDGRVPVKSPVKIAALTARSYDEQIHQSVWNLSAIGVVTDLDDPRFALEIGRNSLWKPMNFIVKAGAGIYFLEPFDPRKVPVLFVHGVSGTPVQFKSLVESLDRSRFQPWLYYYPSAVHLGELGGHLNQVGAALEARYEFDELAIVAYSMGGLIARSAILDANDKSGYDNVPLFISISTPFGGHAAAQIGVDQSPVVVDSWIDMAPGSDFLEGLFYQSSEGRESRRRLPEATRYHMVFGFQKTSGSFGRSGDGVVTLESALRPEAQSESRSLLGLRYTHVGILDSSEMHARVNDLLGATFVRRAAPLPRLRSVFQFEFPKPDSLDDGSESID